VPNRLGAPLTQALGTFYFSKEKCNLTHKFADLANLCFQTGYFANGTTDRIKIYRPESCTFHPLSSMLKRCAKSQIRFEEIIVVSKVILRAKAKCFFGKIMVPEFTCGKLILPFRSQFINFSDWLRVNSGKLMLPGVAILWVK